MILVSLHDLLVAHAGQDWETRILLEPRVGEGELALIENRSPVRLNDPGMYTIATEAGVVGGDSASHFF